MSNAAITITGTIHAMSEVVQKSEKFATREIVINTGGEWAQLLMCQANNGNINQTETLFVGDQVEAQVNLRGREWTSPQGEVKYFNSIEIWKIKAV